MLDHVGFAVSDLECSRTFYEAALAPLGITLRMTVLPEHTEAGGTALGFGIVGQYLWLSLEKPHEDQRRHEDWLAAEAVGEGTHVAFVAETRAKVEAFHRAALAAGGRDNGPPGLRPHYGPDYYAAFVLDPDGINVKAVCRSRA